MSDTRTEHDVASGHSKRDLTSRMRADLHKLEASRPLGLARVQNGWAGLDHRIAKGREAQLTVRGLARIDYHHRYPRLKITRAGRTAIGLPKYEDVQIENEDAACQTVSGGQN